jgi:hypothetical protein
VFITAIDCLSLGRPPSWRRAEPISIRRLGSIHFLILFSFLIQPEDNILTMSRFYDAFAVTFSSTSKDILKNALTAGVYFTPCFLFMPFRQGIDSIHFLQNHILGRRSLYE